VPDAINTHQMTYNGWTMRVRHAAQETAPFFAPAARLDRR